MAISTDISVTLLGTGGATPYAARANACALTRTAQSTVLYDVGSGSCMRLDQAGVPRSEIDIICLSHLHADHCLELPLLVLSTFLDGREDPLLIIGPEGTEAHVHFIFENVFSYIPQLVQGVTGLKPRYEVRESSGGVITDGDSWELKCAPAKHGVPALAYRFAAGNKSVVISGDTEYSDSVIQLASNADVLIHECPFPVEMGSIPGHTTAIEVGQIAAQANVKKLILTHLFEETIGHEESMLAAVHENFSGPTLVGEDLYHENLNAS